MFLKTERLTLRPIEERDIPQICRILSDETVKKTYMVPDLSSDEEAVRLARRYIDCSYDPSRVVVGICLDDQLIGFANDVGVGNGEIELGYAIHPAFHGCGYMTQALTALIAALFAQGFNRVIAGAFKENIASIRVMEKCGMRRIDKMETIAYRGASHECVYYAVRHHEEETKMDHAQKARELFTAGYSCSQAVMGAYAEELGLDMDTAMKLASCFGGGIAGTRELCGAVSGMLMVAGLKWGYCETGILDVKTAHYARTRKLLDAFKAEHGTTVCRDLLVNLGKLKKDPSARTEEYYRVRPCVRFVETAARLLEEMDAADQ